jgi:hypothetical protein
MHYLVKNDTGPQLRLTLTDDISGDPIDLTGGSVTMHFRKMDTTALLFSRVAYISDAVNGICVIQWSAPDLNRAAGLYEAEIEVIDSGGARQTVYETISFTLRDEFA